MTERGLTHDDAEIDAIERRQKQGEKISLQDQLKVLRRREHRLSIAHQTASNTSIAPKQLARLFHRLENTRNQIDEINEQIMNSGDRGGGVMSRGERHIPR